MTNDVKRAYFYAAATREIFIEIPAEDREPGDEAKVARLNLSLYGTRDAAQNWGREVDKLFAGIGFRRGAGSPCNYFHGERELSVTTHGDDFTSTGNDEQLAWLKTKMEEKFEIKTKLLGPDVNDSAEITILNRVLSWEEWGISYEADPRHAEIIVEHLELRSAKPVISPGSKELNDEKDDAALDKDKSSLYRAVVARANYLAQDRPDIQFATKEVC
eukprot:1749607-Karenia_brevis.AAC.1